MPVSSVSDALRPNRTTCKGINLVLQPGNVSQATFECRCHHLHGSEVLYGLGTVCAGLIVRANFW